MLGWEGEVIVPIMEHVNLNAVLDCSTCISQTLPAVAGFYKTPWTDALLYQDGSDEDFSSIGVLRADHCLPAGDMAIVCEMEIVQAVVGCSLVARGCDRLVWRVLPGATAIYVQAIPVTTIRRLFLVVPDFADLFKRSGAHGLPPGHIATSTRGGWRQLGEVEVSSVAPVATRRPDSPRLPVRDPPYLARPLVGLCCGGGKRVVGRRSGARGWPSGGGLGREAVAPLCRTKRTDTLTLPFYLIFLDFSLRVFVLFVLSSHWVV